MVTLQQSNTIIYYSMVCKFSNIKLKEKIVPEDYNNMTPFLGSSKASKSNNIFFRHVKMFKRMINTTLWIELIHGEIEGKWRNTELICFSFHLSVLYVISFKN